ncbi:spore germination protein GerPC [Paenibacillus piri]|nr:spore germination protein GerPC [Paenibacillus piri]
MNYWQQWAFYIQQMQRQIEVQAGQIADLQKSVESLQADMNALKEQKRVHIDKIEYKFDQLKVEKLDGTMNIGLTPSALEELAVNGNTITDAGEGNVGEGCGQTGGTTPYQPLDELQASIRKEMKQYVETHVPKQLEHLQAQYGKELDAWHQKMIVEDLLKQTEARTQYYLQQMAPAASADNMSSIKDSVLFRTRNDIRKAVGNYFNKLTQQNEGEEI